MSMHDFASISLLPVNVTLPGTIGVDFNDSTQPVSFTISVGGAQSNQVTIKAPVGELIRAVTMPESLFISEQSEYCNRGHAMAFDHKLLLMLTLKWCETLYGQKVQKCFIIPVLWTCHNENFLTNCPFIYVRQQESSLCTEVHFSEFSLQWVF